MFKTANNAKYVKNQSVDVQVKSITDFVFFRPNMKKKIWGRIYNCFYDQGKCLRFN